MDLDHRRRPKMDRRELQTQQSIHEKHAEQEVRESVVVDRRSRCDMLQNKEAS